MLIAYGALSFMLFKNANDGIVFDVIDLDPYGSASPFLESSIKNIKNGGIPISLLGLLCVTCTDLAVLCASHPETCFSKYNSIPAKGKLCHEMVFNVPKF
jgi:tRNA (guanine26-N2/guanine27-N2)-dimethyltransferase